MHFSLMFFSSGERGGATATYNHILEFARRADASGWTRVWLPERHFADFGAVHPNPAVLGAAVAAHTRRIRIAAGSVVAPLHDPLRIAEEWAIVDNLSEGRVDLSLAAGWRAEDFALTPGSYAKRVSLLAKSADDVRRLWRGESLSREDGTGTTRAVRTRPRPCQPELPLWITAARSTTSFEMAGALGANLLTYLVDLGFDGMAKRLADYRGARQRAGHAGAGWVTVMLHSFVGAQSDDVRCAIAPAYVDYLVANRELLGASGALTALDATELARAQFERVFERLSLIGGRSACAQVVGRLRELGVDEIACLVDFPADLNLAADALPRLLELADDCAGPSVFSSTVEPPPLVRVDGAAFYAYIEQRGGLYGPVFRWLHSAEANEHRARCELVVPTDLPDGATRALLIDAAVACAHVIGMTPGLRASAHPLGLPLGVDSLRVLAPVQPGARLQAETTLVELTDSSARFDVSVADSGKAVILELRGLRMSRPPQLAHSPASTTPAGLLRSPAWQTTSLEPDSKAKSVVGTGELLGCDDDLARELANGRAPTTTTWVWCGPAAMSADSESLEATIQAWVPRLVADVAHWRAASTAGPMVVVLRGSRRVDHADALPNPLSSALWAAACSLLATPAPGPALWVLDVEAGSSAADVAACTHTLASSAGGGALAWRNGQWWRPTLEPMSVEPKAHVTNTRTLITGGSGGLARPLTAWLAAQGVRDLRLVSRHPERAASWADALASVPGSPRIERRAADLAEAQSAEHALQSQEPWDAVFHLAGDLVDPRGDAGDADAVARCLRPKLGALRRMRAAWGEAPPGQLVLFASIAGLAGSAGQVAYAAANAAMAAAAAIDVAANGTAVTVIWWGPWADVGMAAVPELAPLLAAKGVAPMPPWEALAAMRLALDARLTEVVIARESLITRAAPSTLHVDIMDRWHGELDAASRHALLRNEVLRLLAHIMGVDPEGIDPERNLYELGFDSIMAIELKGVVRALHGLELNLASMLDAGSVNDIIAAIVPALVGKQTERSTLRL